MKSNIGRAFNGHMFRHGASKTIWPLFTGVALQALLACSASASPVVIQITTDPNNQTINDPDHELGLPINHLLGFEIHITNPDMPLPPRGNPGPYEAIIKARFNVQMENSESADVVYQSIDPILLGSGDFGIYGPWTPEANHPDFGTVIYTFFLDPLNVSMTAISAPPGIENHATLAINTTVNFYPLTVAEPPPLRARRSVSEIIPLAPFALNRFQGDSTTILLDGLPPHSPLDAVPNVSVRGRDITSFTVIPEPTSLSLSVIGAISIVGARRKRPIVA